MNPMVPGLTGSKMSSSDEVSIVFEPLHSTRLVLRLVHGGSNG